jgi:hypothetical protein
MMIGAKRDERCESRLTQHNGVDARAWDTTCGTLQLTVPKLRRGSFLPALLEPRRRVDQALANVVVAAWVKGVSTRKIDDLVRQMGVQGMDKSQVSAWPRCWMTTWRLWRLSPGPVLPVPVAGRHLPQSRRRDPTGRVGADRPGRVSGRRRTAATSASSRWPCSCPPKDACQPSHQLSLHRLRSASRLHNAGVRVHRFTPLDETWPCIQSAFR